MPYIKKKEYEKLITEKERTKQIILQILKKYPRSDNYSINGRLFALNYIISEEIKKV